MNIPWPSIQQPAPLQGPTKQRCCACPACGLCNLQVEARACPCFTRGRFQEVFQQIAEMLAQVRGGSPDVLPTEHARSQQRKRLTGFVCCAGILSDSMAGITLFLPTNDAVNATLTKFGLDLEGLLKNQELVDEVISYHILPSPIEVSCSCHTSAHTFVPTGFSSMHIDVWDYCGPHMNTLAGEHIRISGVWHAWIRVTSQFEGPHQHQQRCQGLHELCS